MFEEPNNCMDDMLAALAIEKIRYDHTGTLIGAPLDSDSLSEIYYGALDDVAPSDSAWKEDDDTYIQKFFFWLSYTYSPYCITW